jgi:hypothetical protein
MYRCEWSLTDESSNRVEGFEMQWPDSLGAILHSLLSMAASLNFDEFRVGVMRGTGLPKLVEADLEHGATYLLPAPQFADPEDEEKYGYLIDPERSPLWHHDDPSWEGPPPPQ